MASLLTTALKQVGQLHKTDDDLVDRLNHRFTVILLVTFTTFVSAKQFIGEPISCWTPAQFSDPQISYTNSICWLKGTYYLAADRRTIPHHTQNSEFRIAYYQFVPYMLLVMAVLFYLPHMLWHNISRHIGFDFRSIILDLKDVLKTAKKSEIDQVAKQIHIALEYNSSKRNHLSLLYILVKLLYSINCLCQFYLLSLFLSFPFHTFGIDWLLDALRKVHTRANIESNDSKWFPRVVMCDFMVRHLGSNQHQIAVQCNLPINLFNELIFLIIWTWFIFLTGLTCLSFIWYFISLYNKMGYSFIYKYLHMNLPELEKKEGNEFITKYLRPNGIIVLRILGNNTNDIVMAKLVKALYDFHLKPSEESINDNESNDQKKSNGHYTLIDNSSV